MPPPKKNPLKIIMKDNIIIIIIMIIMKSLISKLAITSQQDCCTIFVRSLNWALGTCHNHEPSKTITTLSLPL